VSPEGLCEDTFHESLEGPWDCSGDRAEEGRPEMLLQTGADRREMPFLLTSFRAIVKRKALPKSSPRSRPVNPHSIGERGRGRRERNTARNEGVLRTINGFESIVHLAHSLPPHLHYGRYDLCSN
jgi:hypothetical protein